MNTLKHPDFILPCRKCGKDAADYELKPHVFECDTPIGNVRVAGFKAICKDCGTDISNHELNEYNSVRMALCTIGEYRRRNPDKTKKQCHRALGLQKAVVDKFWNFSMKDDFHPLTDEEVAEIT